MSFLDLVYGSKSSLLLSYRFIFLASGKQIRSLNRILNGSKSYLQLSYSIVFLRFSIWEQELSSTVLQIYLSRLRERDQLP